MTVITGWRDGVVGADMALNAIRSVVRFVECETRALVLERRRIPRLVAT